MSDDRAHFSDGAGNIPGREWTSDRWRPQACMRRYLLSGASLGAGIDASMHKSGGGLPRASGGGVGKVDHSANVGQMRQPPFIHPALYA